MDMHGDAIHAETKLKKVGNKRRRSGRDWRVLKLFLTACLGVKLWAGTPPNVLMLISDDQRFDTIRALGNREVKTPNLDRLVANGFAFTQAFIMGAGQGAVCVPSRAMLMTGRSLFRATATYGNGVIPVGNVTLPETLRQAGYDTLAVGKWHNDQASFKRAFTGGGTIFFGGMSNQRAVPVFDFNPLGSYPRTNAQTNDTFSAELFANTAIALLQQPERSRPFFLYVAFTTPHDPRTPPEEFARQYDPRRIKLPRSFLPEHPFDNGELKVRDEALLPWPRTAAAVKQEIASYYAMVSHLDYQIGRIVKTLEDTGLARNTLIVFAGDNGLALGRHGLLGKQNLYEHSVRVPLIVSGPGVPRGKRSDALCYLFDLFPTVLEGLSLSAPPGIEGISLWPIIQGRTRRVREEVFGAYRDVQRMVRDERWKLIYYPRINRTQLFDLKKDPEELKDLSEMKAHRDRLVEMRKRLEAARQTLGDPNR